MTIEKKLLHFDSFYHQEILSEIITKNLPNDCKYDVNIKTTTEMDKFAMQYAKIIASKTFTKISSSLPSGTSIEDIEAELLFAYVERSKTIRRSGEKGMNSENNWKGYISKIYFTVSRDIIMKVFDDQARNSQVISNSDTLVGLEFSDKGDIEHIVIDVKNPETLLINTQEEREMVQKVEILLTDIKDFCYQFNIEFNKKDPLKSMMEVLNLTLNEFTDEEFSKLDRTTRKRLGELGDAVVKQGLYIRLDPRKIKVQGIVAIIRKYFKRGINTTSAILKELDQNGILYNKQSVLAIVPKLRKEAGLPQVRLGLSRSISGIIRKEFNEGRGIVTVPEMSLRLKELGIPFIPSSLRLIVYDLRKEYNLKRK